MRNYFKKLIFGTVTVAALCSIVFVHAQGTPPVPLQTDGGSAPVQSTITPLAPIIGTLIDNNCDPKSATACKTNFVVYLKGLFKLVIAIGSILAVIMITVGGFEYMLSASELGKTNGMDRIKNALIGLGLALASYLILYTINPDLTGLSNIKSVTVNTPNSGQILTPSGGNTTSPEERARLQQIIQETRAAVTNSAPITNPTAYVITTTTYNGVSTENSTALNALKSELKAKLVELDGDIRPLIGEDTTLVNILNARNALQTAIAALPTQLSNGIAAVKLSTEATGEETAAALATAKAAAELEIQKAIEAKLIELRDAIDYRQRCPKDNIVTRVGKGAQARTVVTKCN